MSHGVIGSTSGFDPLSLGSSPSGTTNEAGFCGVKIEDIC
jgi:hypothetical protein